MSDGSDRLVAGLWVLLALIVVGVVLAVFYELGYHTSNAAGIEFGVVGTAAFGVVLTVSSVFLLVAAIYLLGYLVTGFPDHVREVVKRE